MRITSRNGVHNGLEPFAHCQKVARACNIVGRVPLLERIVESQHTGCVERRGAPGLGNIECIFQVSKRPKLRYPQAS